MIPHRSDRIRRAAILVASLEEELAEGLLRTLPPREVEEIYAELETLDEIDAEEQADVLDEFRRRTRRDPQLADGVEFTPSIAEPIVAPPRAAVAEPQSPLHGVDHAMLARILAAEHPQTVAAAMSRLGAELGAEVFAALPASLQNEVIDRIVNLQAVDDVAATELESQLMRRVSECRDREDRRAASADLARKLVSQVAPAARDGLLARLRLSDPVTPTPTKAPWTAASAEQRAADLLQAFVAPDDDESSATDRPSANFPRIADETVDELADEWIAAEDALDLDDCSRALEALNDRALVAGMQQLDEQTVLYALAASSDRIVRRVAKRLSRANSAQLKSMLRSLGPVRVADLRVAQHALLEAAGTGVGTTRLAG